MVFQSNVLVNFDSQPREQRGKVAIANFVVQIGLEAGVAQSGDHPVDGALFQLLQAIDGADGDELRANADAACQFDGEIGFEADQPAAGVQHPEGGVVRFDADDQGTALLN